MWYIVPLGGVVFVALFLFLGVIGMGGMWWQENSGWVIPACSFGLGVLLSLPFVVGAVSAFAVASSEDSKERKVERTIWQITSVGCAVLGIWIAFLFRESEHGVLTVIIMAAGLLLIEGLLLVFGIMTNDGHRFRGLITSVISLIPPIVLMMWSIGWNLSYVTKVQNSNIAYYEVTPQSVRVKADLVENELLFSEPQGHSNDFVADNAIGSFSVGDHLASLGNVKHYESSLFVTNDLADWAEVQLADGTSGWVYLGGMIPHYWRAAEAISMQQDQIIQESFMKLLPKSTLESAVLFFDENAFLYEVEYADE